MPIGKFFGAQADVKKKDDDKAPAKVQAAPDSKPAKRKSIGQRMVERAGY
jgi:hypothetical protein